MADREEVWRFTGDTRDLEAAAARVQAVERSLAQAAGTIASQVRSAQAAVKELAAALDQARRASESGLALPAALQSTTFDPRQSQFRSAQSGQFVSAQAVQAELTRTLAAWQADLARARAQAEQPGVGGGGAGGGATTAATAASSDLAAAQARVAAAAQQGTLSMRDQTLTMDLLAVAQRRLAQATLAWDSAVSAAAAKTDDLRAREEALQATIQAQGAATTEGVAAIKSLLTVQDAQAANDARLAKAADKYVLALQSVRNALRLVSPAQGGAGVAVPVTEAPVPTTGDVLPGADVSAAVNAELSRMRTLLAEATAELARAKQAAADATQAGLSSVDALQARVGQISQVVQRAMREITALEGAEAAALAAAAGPSAVAAGGAGGPAAAPGTSGAQAAAAAANARATEQDAAAAQADAAAQATLQAALLQTRTALTEVNAASLAAERAGASRTASGRAQLGVMQSTIDKLREEASAYRTALFQPAADRDPAVLLRAQAAAAQAAATAAAQAAAADRNLAAAAGDAASGTNAAGQAANRSTQYWIRHAQSLLLNQVAYAALNVVTQAVHNTLAGITDAIKLGQDAQVIYAQRLGTTTAAQARFNIMMKEGLAIGIPDKELLQLDEDLARLGVDSNTSQQRFGRSIAALRRDLEDLALVPNMTVDQVTELFNRSSEGAMRLVASLQNLGLATKPELEALGVEFSGLSNQIISDGDTVARAILSLVETKFGGLAETQAKTLEGLQTRLGNSLTNLASIAGRPLFDKLQGSLTSLLNTLSDPRVGKAAGDFGSGLGSVGAVLTTALTTAVQLFTIADRDVALFDASLGPVLRDLQVLATNGDLARDSLRLLFGDHQIGAAMARYAAGLQVLIEGFLALGAISTGDTQAAAEHFVAMTRDANAMQGGAVAATALAQSQQELAAATDAGSQALDRQRAEADALNQQMAELKGAVSDLEAARADALATPQAALDTLNKTSAGVDANLDRISGSMQDLLRNMRRATQEADLATTEQLRPVQDDLTRLGQEADALRTKYDALIAPLKAQEDALDRIYNAQQMSTRQDALAKNIERDRAAAANMYSSQGQAAALRLQDELVQQQQLQAEQDHTNAKQNLEDQISGLGTARDKALAANDRQQRADQAQIAALERERTLRDEMAQKQEMAIQKSLDNLGDAKKKLDDAYASQKAGLQGNIDQVNTLYDSLEAGFKTQETYLDRALTVLQTGADLVVTTSNNALARLNDIRNAITAIKAASGDLSPGAVPGGFAPPPPTAVPPPGRASGGPVSVGTLYRVNEPGSGEQEYFRPAVSGVIGPGLNGQYAGTRGGSTQVTVGGTVTIRLTDREGRLLLERALDGNEDLLMRAVTHAAGVF